MKKILLVICLILSVESFANKKADKKLTLHLSEEIYNTKGLDFIPHTGSQAMTNYLAMNLNYKAVKVLFEELQTKLGKKLINREEAHITVVTPVEFDQVLSKFLTMDQINRIAQNLKIQESPFTIQCLGRGVVGKDETYFLVIKSEALEKIRAKITEEFISNRGMPGAFKPYKNFFGHITVGFTKRDLHAQDGIKKDESSCFADVKLEK